MEKLNTEEFIKRAKQVHKNKYNYSKVDYKNLMTKVIIICPIHGEFKQTPGNHIFNQHGCPYCSGKIKYTLEEFKERANKIHNNKYDYSKIKKYNNCKEKVIIICPIHGEFKQTPEMHTNQKNGCPFCAELQRRASNTKTTEKFIEEAEQTHGKFYDYSKTSYKRDNEKVTIICPIHGEFKQQAHSHINGCGCSRCTKSRGHKKIALFLEENNIFFKEEERLEGCVNPKTGYKLIFDFYLPEQNICIEYDGEQHFTPLKMWCSVKSFEKLQKRDLIKTTYCLDKNIRLIRIKYDEDDILKNIKAIL